MIIRFSNKLFIFLILILGFGQLPVSGSVLCFGNDGHVAIEKGTDNLNCTHPVINHSESLMNLSSLNSLADLNHCGSCNDISLSNNNLESKAVSTVFSISDINPNNSFFISLNFPLELKSETIKRNKRIHSKSVSYSYLPQIEKVVIIC